jgi:hypothetical protein
LIALAGKLRRAHQIGAWSAATYFLMNLGIPGVKADVMVKRFVEAALGAATSAENAANLVTNAADNLNAGRTAMAGKFEIAKDEAGKYRWHLKAANGEIIAASQAYEKKANAEKGIEAAKKAAAGATVADLTEETAKK